jgi:hypothetical protein
MVAIYNRTKNNSHLGAGFMFLYASFLYLIGAVIVSFLPFVQQYHEKPQRVSLMLPLLGRTGQLDQNARLQQPLLPTDPEQPNHQVS